MEYDDDLYRDVIIDHYSSPRNKHVMEDYHKHEGGVNRSCGDEIDIFVKLDGNVISDISFSGVGCSISQASASMLTEAVKGKSLEDAEKVIGKFKSMLLENANPDFSNDNPDLEVLQGVKQYPVRIKCALLSWNTLEQIIKDSK